MNTSASAERRSTARFSNSCKSWPAKGLLLRDEARRAHVYKAARPREWTQQQLAGHLLERAFSGSAKALLIGALSAKKATKTELVELRKLVNEYAKEAK